MSTAISRLRTRVARTSLAAPRRIPTSRKAASLPIPTSRAKDAGLFQLAAVQNNLARQWRYFPIKDDGPERKTQASRASKTSLNKLFHRVQMHLRVKDVEKADQCFKMFVYHNPVDESLKREMYERAAGLFLHYSHLRKVREILARQRKQKIELQGQWKGMKEILDCIIGQEDLKEEKVLESTESVFMDRTKSISDAFLARIVEHLTKSEVSAQLPGAIMKLYLRHQDGAYRLHPILITQLIIHSLRHGLSQNARQLLDYHSETVSLRQGNRHEKDMLPYTAYICGINNGRRKLEYQPVLEEMQQLGVALDVSLLNALIQAEVRVKSYVRAFRLYRIVLQVDGEGAPGIRPDVYTYSSLFKAVYMYTTREADRRRNREFADVMFTPRTLFRNMVEHHTAALEEKEFPVVRELVITERLMCRALSLFISLGDFAAARVALRAYNGLYPSLPLSEAIMRTALDSLARYARADLRKAANGDNMGTREWIDLFMDFKQGERRALLGDSIDTFAARIVALGATLAVQRTGQNLPQRLADARLSGPVDADQVDWNAVYARIDDRFLIDVLLRALHASLGFPSWIWPARMKTFEIAINKAVAEAQDEMLPPELIPEDLPFAEPGNARDSTPEPVQYEIRRRRFKRPKHTRTPSIPINADVTGPNSTTLDSTSSTPPTPADWHSNNTPHTDADSSVKPP